MGLRLRCERRACSGSGHSRSRFGTSTVGQEQPLAADHSRAVDRPRRVTSATSLHPARVGWRALQVQAPNDERSMNKHNTSTIAHLVMVDSPMSNSQAAFLEEMANDLPHLRRSDFYMLTARPTARIENIVHDDANSTIHFDICVGAELRDRGALHYAIEPAYDAFEGSLVLSATADLISATNKATGEVFMAYSPDSMLWWKSRSRPGLSGLARARELSTFDLLYVGIAKEGDSYSRLIERGHKQRAQILAKELPRVPGARVADETYLFFFEVSPTIVRTFDPAIEINDGDLDQTAPLKRYVADAEKAFVTLLQPGYNKTLYKSYPRGSDGLYGEGLARYGYAVAEEIILNTPNGQICGARAPFVDLPWSNRADTIFIEGDVVQLLKAGIDFPDVEPI